MRKCKACSSEFEWSQGGRGRPPLYCFNCRAIRGIAGQSGRETAPELLKAAEERREAYKAYLNKFREEREAKAIVMREEYLKEGATIQSVGDTFGVTRERVRQILEEFYPGLIKETRRSRNAAVREAREIQREMERPFVVRTCKVCGKEFETNLAKVITCDQECSRLLVKIRGMIDPAWHDRHRYHVAKQIIKHPERHNEFQFQSAVRSLEYYEKHGFMPPPNRGFNTRSGKNYKQLLKKVGKRRIEALYAARDEYYSGRPPIESPSRKKKVTV